MRIDTVGPLPQRLLSCTATDDELVPAWLSDRDRPWLRDLLHDAEALSGRPLGELERRWRCSEWDLRAGRRLAVARHVLRGLLRRAAPAPPMATVRQELFTAAATATREQALARVAADHGFSVDSLVERLFADLPRARCIVWPEPAPDPTRFLLLANLAIAKGMLVRARSAELHLDGAARAVLRTACLQGAGFAVEGSGPEGVRLRWRHAAATRTTALSAIVPVLPWARRFLLRARCAVQGSEGTFVLATGDAILPGPEPRWFDSGLERAFARDAAALAPAWEVLREPTPLAVAGSLCFPDFGLRRRADGEQWLLEIAGLRDPAALATKLALLAAAPRYVLCLPRPLVPPEWRGHPRIVPFDRRVALADVMRCIALRSTGGGETTAASPPP